MLGVLSDDLHASTRAVGMLPTLTQLGYALGILLLSPLGDRFDRRRVIVAKAAGAQCGPCCSRAPRPPSHVLLVASLAIGLSATVAQDIVPAAATLAPEAHRGQVVGTVMTGLLLGILLSRVVSGFIAEHFGWRTMFCWPPPASRLFAAAAWRGAAPLPAHQPPELYGALLRSLGAAVEGATARCAAPRLRRACWPSASARSGPRWRSCCTGALPPRAAPPPEPSAWPERRVRLLRRWRVGLADRRGARIVTRIGAGLALVSSPRWRCWPWLVPGARLGCWRSPRVGFDLGVQVTLIAHQTIVYAVDPAARSRLNALLFVSMFIGMSIGAALGGAAARAVGLARGGGPGHRLLGAGAARALPAPGASLPGGMSSPQRGQPHRTVAGLGVI